MSGRDARRRRWPLLAPVALLALLVALWAAHPGQAGEDANMLRENVDISADTRAAATPPGEVDYDTWFRGDTRVTFDHALHTEGLELACGECHHTESCSQCHQEGRTTTLVRSGQIALHEVCFRCHAQEPRGESCGQCHQPTAATTADVHAGVSKSPQVGREFQAWMLASLDEVGDSLSFTGERAPREREVNPPPADRIFVTSQNGVSIVAFDHKTHAAGLECSACHHMDRCGVCHADLQHKVSVRSTQDAVMQNCVRCHDNLGQSTECSGCHIDPHQH